MEILIVILILIFIGWLSSQNTVSTDTTATPIKREPPYTSAKAAATWNRPKPQQTLDYDTYIKSDEWRRSAVRIATLTSSNYLCQACFEPSATVDVHHITYKDLGKEKPDQLVTLCRECHDHTHKIAGKGAGTYPPIKKP